MLEQFRCYLLGGHGGRGRVIIVQALEMADDKEAIEKFGSSDSGASLGDILGAALAEKIGDAAFAAANPAGQADDERHAAKGFADST